MDRVTPFDRSSTATEAAQWLARRDRGFTPEEADAYARWLAADPRHTVVLRQHEAVLKRLTGLAGALPDAAAEPDADLFAPPARPSKAAGGWRPALLVAAAALVVVAAVRFLGVPDAPAPAPTLASHTYLRTNERQTLPDGSVVELGEGARIEVRFTDAERRVRLAGGQAHFAVAKNPARPFVVEAGGIGVRAVGTEFDVQVDSTRVDVLVTEGKVRVEPIVSPGDTAAFEALPLLSAGHRTQVMLAAAAPAPRIETLNAEEMATAARWKTPRLQFQETPLAEAIAEFNRHNARRLLLADAKLGAVPIGGTFRVDNLEAFVRLLELTLDVRAEPQDGGAILLHAAR